MSIYPSVSNYYQINAAIQVKLHNKTMYFVKEKKLQSEHKSQNKCEKQNDSLWVFRSETHNMASWQIKNEIKNRMNYFPRTSIAGEARKHHVLEKTGLTLHNWNGTPSTFIEQFEPLCRGRENITLLGMTQKMVLFSTALHSAFMADFLYFQICTWKFSKRDRKSELMMKWYDWQQ